VGLIARTKRALLDRLARSQLLYTAARRIVSRHDGDNDVNMETNGEHALLRRALPEAKVAFDVGANVGDWAAAALAINPALELHAFEPSPTTFATLAARGLPASVRLVNAGLGAEDQELSLHVVADGHGNNSLYERRGVDLAAQRQERVRLLPLDRYCAEQSVERIDYLKIDVEGHEVSVLRGARELLRDGRIGLITFEYGGTYIDARSLLRDVWELVEATNPAYAFFKLHHDGPRRVERYRQTYETFQYSNWVIMSPDHPAAR
jgi:FkbM family methyltransferase